MPNVNYEQLYNDFKTEVDDVIKFDDFQLAWQFYNKIREIIKNNKHIKNNPEINKKYNELLDKLRWVALPFFNRNEVLNLFSKHFQIIFQMEYFDLWEKLKHALLGILPHEDRDKVKQEIGRILNHNQSSITAKRLKNNNTPTIENWIKHYTAELGTGPVDRVNLQQFFVNDKNIKILDSKDKSRIVIFFEFYERLKLSSYTVAGTEEVVPVTTSKFQGYIADGKLTRLSRMTSEQEKIWNAVTGQMPDEKLRELEQDEKQFQEGSLEKLAIDEEIDKQKKIDKLQVVADSFPKGSLQHKAMMEEIEKIKRQ